MKCETQFAVHGQWWSILGIHLSHEVSSLSYLKLYYVHRLPLACLAMMCSWWLEGFTSTAPSLSATSTVGFQLLAVSRPPVSRNTSWVYSASSIVAYPDTKGEDVNAP